jgi:hypothetical protein
MQFLERISEVTDQISTFVNLSLMDIVSSAFMRLVTFIVNLLLGL